MRNHIILLLLHLCLLSNAQQYTDDRKGFCGTETKDAFIEDVKRLSKEVRRFAQSRDRAVATDYPVTVHVIRRSDGTGGIVIDSFLNALEEVNDMIAPSGVSIKVCGEIRYINSDQYYDFYKPDENNLYYSTRVPNTMNLYISNSLTYASGAVRCGYAYFPGWKDMVLIDRHCLLDGSTFTHEVGHYFGLLHTHGNEISDTEELIDQSNCMITGDDVCDTPADPLLTWSVDSLTCEYTGTDTDENGAPYMPDPSNIMSYAPKSCKTTLTQGQYDRMAYVAAFLRDYMSCQSFTAEFELDEEVGICGESHTISANYIGTAEEIDLAWDLDSDGIIDATDPFTEFTFTTPGRHDICLLAMAEGDTVRQCHTYAVLGSASGAHSVQVDNFADCALLNDDGDHGWQVVDLDSSNADVLMMNNFHYNTSGEEDHIIICPIDLEGLTEPILQFDLGYVPFNENRADALRVEISTDCGVSYQEVFFGEGLDISSTGAYSGAQWQPYHPQDWQSVIIELSEFLSETIVIRITNITGHGNYMYIKNISVSDNDPLPVRFISIDVKEHSNGHVILWETANELGLETYNVQASLDGLLFEDLGTKEPAGEAINTYSFLTPAPLHNVYYRIEARFEDASTEYSSIRSMGTSNLRRIEVYPNPAVYQIRLSDFTGNYSMFNAAGELIRDQVEYSGAIDVSNLTPGMYIIYAGGESFRFTKSAF